MENVKDNLQLDDVWLEAMRKEDGCRLMDCLANEPRLVTIRCAGCNVLHLAIRHDWYGLVKQILELFEDLADVDSIARSGLGVEVLRDLLTEKEGDGWPSTDAMYSSGLDSLGMAVIQCNMAVNTMLAHTILKLHRLFPRDHPYKVVVTNAMYLTSSSNHRLGLGWLDWEGIRSFDDGDKLLGDDDAAEPEDDTRPNKKDGKELLCEIMVECYPHLTEWLRPFKSFGGCLGETNNYSQAHMYTYGTGSAALRQLPGIVRKWILRAPYIPLAEYLLVEYAIGWSTPIYELVYSHDVLGEWISDKICSAPTDVICYILGISDSRRTIFHYTLYNNAHVHAHDPLTPSLRGYVEIPNIPMTMAHDQSSPKNFGHNPLMTLIDETNIPMDYFDVLNDSVAKPMHVLLGSMPARDCISKAFNPNMSWDPLNCCCWSYDGLQYKVDLKAVHEVNGYTFYSNPHRISQRDGLRPVHIVLTCPHLSDSEKKDWIGMLLNEEYYPNRKVDASIHCPRPVAGYDGVVEDQWITSLQLAALMGSSASVKQLLKCGVVNDPALIDKVEEISTPRVYMYAEEEDEHRTSKSVLHFAAKEAEPEILRIILGTGKFDASYHDADGNTVLHSAAFCSGSSTMVMLLDFAEIPEKHYGGRPEPASARQSEQRIRLLESRRQGCVNLLLQEGADVWEANDDNNIPDPGPDASPEYSLWWYEKLTHETMEQKSSFSTAATAISVTAALIATASYVGPLQPPLGYSSEDGDQIGKVQAGISSVRVFLVCNTAAFYLALAAIMLSLTPSLPMPHESTRGELKRIRRSITAALLFLTVSIVTIFAAFASASLVIIPKGDSWNQLWLTGSTLLTLGPICVVVWMLCCIRVIRLLFHNNSTVKRFYGRWVYI